MLIKVLNIDQVRPNLKLVMENINGKTACTRDTMDKTHNMQPNFIAKDKWDTYASLVLYKCSKSKYFMGLLKKGRKCVYRGHDTANGGGWIVPLKPRFDSRIGAGTF